MAVFQKRFSRGGRGGRGGLCFSSANSAYSACKSFSYDPSSPGRASSEVRATHFHLPQRKWVTRIARKKSARPGDDGIDGWGLGGPTLPPRSGVQGAFLEMGRFCKT